MLRHNIREDAGQALVELALVFPILLLFLVGSVELGRLAYAAIEVNDAARAGVAYGAQSHTTASDSSNITLAATTESPDITSMTATTSQFCSCSDGTSITCTNAGTKCLSPAHIIEYVQVNTTAPVATLFHFPGIASSMTLRGQAIMRVEQ